MRRPDYDRRVVVTGLGVISPVGNDKTSAWTSLINGKSGLDTITKFDPSPYEAKLAGEQKPRGWGLFLIKHMVDAMEVVTDGDTQTVVLTLHLEGGHDASPAV